MECRWLDEKWIESLLWCPSQCYRRVECNGRVYTLYLRWRWEDPWKFRVAEGDMVSQQGLYVIDTRSGEAGRLVGFNETGGIKVEKLKWRFVTEDLFARENLFFAAEQLEEAEKKAEDLFFKWLREKQQRE